MRVFCIFQKILFDLCGMTSKVTVKKNEDANKIIKGHLEKYTFILNFKLNTSDIDVWKECLCQKVMTFLFVYSE